jgi:hypothetical protein
VGRAASPFSEPVAPLSVGQQLPYARPFRWLRGSYPGSPSMALPNVRIRSGKSLGCGGRLLRGLHGTRSDRLNSFSPRGLERIGRAQDGPAPHLPRRRSNWEKSPRSSRHVHHDP